MSQNIQQRAQMQPEPVPRKGAKWWRKLVFWMRAWVLVAFVPLVFGAAAAVMMIDRDITAPSWIITRIEARAAAVFPDVGLEFGAMTVRVGRDLHPRVRLYNSRLTAPDGSTLTQIPLIEGLISPRGLILRQDVLMQEVRLSGAQFNLRRSANGDLSVAFNAAGRDLRQAPSLPALLEQFDDLFERPALEALEIVSADGLILNFDDARARRNWLVDGASATLDLRDGLTQIRADFSVLSGRATATQVQLSYQSPRGQRAAQIGLNLTDANATDIAAQTAALSWLRGVDAPITAALRTSLDGDGALGPLNARLDIGQGEFQPNPATPAVPFDDARAYFTYDPVQNALSFSEMVVQTAWGEFAANGDAFLQDFSDGLPRSLVAQLRFRDMAIDPPGFFETAPQVPEMAVDLRARFDPFSVEVGQLVLRDVETRLTAGGALKATDAGWDMAFDAQIEEITPQRLLAFWPQTMKPRSRAWMAANVSEGQLRNVVAGLRMRPERAAQFALGFEFADTQIKIFREIAPITGAYGVGSLIDHQFVVSLDEGGVAAPQGGRVDLAGTSFRIVDLRLKPSPAVLDLQAESTLTAALSVLNQPPFGYPDKANLPVTIARAQAYTSGQITWPMVPRPDPDTVQFDVAAQLRNVRSDTLLEGRSFAAPRLDVTTSRAGINIAGPVRVGDARALVVWDQRFGDPALPGSRILAQAQLDQAFLDEFNIALPQGTISGAGTGELAITLRDGVLPQFSLTSDLVGIGVFVPPVGWRKALQSSGELRVAGTLGPVPEIADLTLSGPGLRAQGRLDLNGSGGLRAATFSQVRVGDWLDAAVTLRARGQGEPVAVEIDGGTLDLRRAQFGGSGGQGGPMRLALDRLQVSDGIALTNLRGNFRSEDGFRGEFSGSLNGAAPVTGAIAPRNGRTAVRLRSEDAGAVLRAAGLMQTAVGGALDLTLLPVAGAGTFDGTLAIDSIRVQDAPAIAAILDAVSVVGLLQQLDGQGLAFDEVNAAFRLMPDRVVISQASAVGPGLGISVDGIYRLGPKEIDLQGVVSPFFLINSIGSFLTRRGEGLIGFSYTIGGTAAAPQVNVNPLSVLTPGMFREIFRRPAPDVAQ